MVRLLKAGCIQFDEEEGMHKFLSREMFFAVVHLVESTCLTFGVLAGVAVVPYVARYMWHLLLVGSFCLVVGNCRDACFATSHFFYGCLGCRNAGKEVSGAAKGHQGSTGALMEMMASLTMALGSLSLLNGAVIGMLKQTSVPNEFSGRQIVLGFALHFLGAGGNNVVSDTSLGAQHNTRAILSFLHVFGSAALFVCSLLQLPSMGYEEAEVVYKTVVVASASMGAIATIISAPMYYFHTMAFCAVQQDFYFRSANKACLWMEAENESNRLGARPGYMARLRQVVQGKAKSLIWRNERKPVGSEEDCLDMLSSSETDASTDRLTTCQSDQAILTSSSEQSWSQD